MALMVCAAVVTYAKPKKGVKTQNAQTTTTVARLNCTVESDGTVKEADGTVIGTVNAEGKIINAAGQVIGSMGRTDAQKIQEVYFAD
jgi:hypothetical protein